MKLRRQVIFVSIFALACGSASAQAVGTYVGTSADNNRVSFTVTKDSTTHKLMITGASIAYTAPCPSGFPTVNSGIGFGPNVVIASKHAKYVGSLPSYFFESFTLTFDTSNNTISGTVTSVTPQLQQRTGIPTRSYTCTSPTQSLTATLQVPATAPALKTPTSLHYGQ
jgi:hypothetical protein